MTDYNTLSDFEINKRVAILLNHECFEFERVFDTSRVLGFDDEFSILVDADYCNNPADAWPVIEQVWDKLHEPVYDSENKYADCVWNAYQSAYLCGPIKAAIICYLKMNEA